MELSRSSQESQRKPSQSESFFPEAAVFEIEMVERADEMLHFLVLYSRAAASRALRIVPLNELCKFIAHEIELLAGVRDLIGEKTCADC